MAALAMALKVLTISTIIMDGKLFINIPNLRRWTTRQFKCIDLATGKVLYTANGSITGGIHLPGNAYATIRISVLSET